MPLAVAYLQRVSAALSDQSRESALTLLESLRIDARDFIQGDRLWHSEIRIVLRLTQQRGDKQPRDGSAFVVFEHHFAAFVGFVRKKSNPAVTIRRERDKLGASIKVRNVNGVAAPRQTDGQVVQSAPARSDEPFGLRRIAREFGEFVFNPIHKPNRGARERDQRRG